MHGLITQPLSQVKELEKYVKKTKKNSKNQDFFALDIGASAVRVLQIIKKGGQWVVMGAGQAPITRNVVADKSILDTTALAKAIDMATKSARIKSKNVYASMPSSQATIETINIPADLDEMEREDYVSVEASNHIPFPVEDVRMDFDVIGKSEADDELLEVMLVAAKSDHFQMMVDSIREADLNVEVMDVDELAIERAMGFIIDKHPIPNTNDPLEVVIDLGHEFTTIHVLNDGKSIYNREQQFGMKQLIDEISRKFEVSTPEAIQGIRNANLGDEFKNEMLPQFRNDVAGQINRLIQFFFAATSYNRVHRIWVCGGGAGLPGVAEEVAELTGVQTRILNPLSDVQINKGVDLNYVKHNGSSFLSAFGLAIRED